jgi:hypothetical protein
MEFNYRFGDDDPGDIVEALNNDKSVILYDLNSDGSGVMIRIDYLGITIKESKNGTDFGRISNGGA